MTRKRREVNPADLTTDEISLLRGANVPPAITEYLKRSHEDIGLKISAYQKVAAAAKAEREALTEVHALGIVRAQLGDPPERLRSKAVSALEEENVNLRRQLRQATAIPALAVNSND